MCIVHFNIKKNFIIDEMAQKHIHKMLVQMTGGSTEVYHVNRDKIFITGCGKQ